MYPTWKNASNASQSSARDVKPAACNALSSDANAIPQGAVRTYRGLIPNRSRASSKVSVEASQIANANMPRSGLTQSRPRSSYR